MVLVQLPPPPNPKTNPNSNWGGGGGNFPWGNCLDTLPHNCSYNIRFIFTKGAFTYYLITEGERVFSKMLIHNYGRKGGRGGWPYDISKNYFLQSEIILKQKTTINYL